VWVGLSQLAVHPTFKATNAINDIMDDKTAAATQRWQRLMIQVRRKNTELG